MAGNTIALIVAASSLPAFLAAHLLRGDRPRMARMMRLVGVAIIAGAAGLVWAEGNEARTLAVALAVAIAVNGLGVAILVDAVKRRDGRR